MDLELLQLALKSLSAEIQGLKEENKTLRGELSEIKRFLQNTTISSLKQKSIAEEDELLPLSIARKILHVGRNTFLALVKSGVINPIRMNLRTIRYSRIELQRYIEQQR